MSAVLEIHEDETPAPAAVAGPRTDTLAESVVVLLVLAAVQRIVGFARGVLVCRWLNPDELGHWDMAFGFLTLAAPLTVLGLPGSFGRYVEYFRQRGQLNALIKRTAIACSVLAALALAGICILRPLVSTIVFGHPGESQLVTVLAISLVSVIAFNYLTELITALRMARKTAVVQFFNSLMFAGFSVLLLFAWQRDASALVAAYGLACALQIGGMIWFLRRAWRSIPQPNPASLTLAVDKGQGEGAAEVAPSFWPRLLSFAAWVWVTNLLYNLFDVIDRYMIVHTSGAADPLAVVGSYHSSRIVPLLLVSIASLMGTMILPHLSHDWEAGRRRAVSDRMNLALKLLGLLLFVGSITILLAGPLLFDVAFQGKFARGKEALPWTLTYCSWFGLVTMAQLYLWCAERARLGCFALLIGLLTNIGLNSLLLPHFGLLGAVWATGVANFTALALVYRFNSWLGMKIQPALFVISLLPLTLGCGPWVALAALALTIAGIVFTDFLFSHDEKQRVLAVVHTYANRFRRHADSTTPVMTEPSQRPLRIMFIITSMHIGGMETLLVNLLRRLDRSRIAPELCCLKEPGELGEKLAAEIPLTANLLRHKFDLRILPRLTRLLRNRQIDAVITVGAGDKLFWGRVAAWRAGVPIIVSALHSTGWPDGITWLNRRLTRLNDAFIAVATGQARHLIQHERLPAGRVVVIPNGVDTEIYRPNLSRTSAADLRQQLGIPATAPVIGIVAVLRPEKNHELFLQAAARVRREVPEAHFAIIGDGPRRGELELLTSQLGLVDSVHFLGRRSDVPQLLNLLDVFALTSHNEANPVSILEAAATGRPIVATRVGSIPETVLEGVTGYLVDPGDELSLARRIMELLTDPAKAQRLGAAGRRHVVDHWSLDHMVGGYEELIERIHNQKTGFQPSCESWDASLRN